MRDLSTHARERRITCALSSCWHVALSASARPRLADGVDAQSMRAS
jgi:hypothetical protein